ncbi:MAG: TRAP transporter substrate-binding protein [Deltaproteobacteria bacterium]|nr:TRAP transporter substrate-binding protein [Deltaproteobacteria bacterium]
MKVRGWSLVFCLVLAFGAVSVFGVTAVQAGAIDLAYANFFPPTHIQAKLGASWAKEIEKRTKGKVKITYHPGSVLLNPKNMWDGVLKGRADIGMGVFAYNRGIFPSLEAIDLPMGYPSGKVATRVINDFYNKFNPKELSSVKVMYLHAHGPGLLHSQKPVKKLEDMKGLKVRSTGSSAALVKEMGGVPVTMGQKGAYEALQKGVANATLSPIEVLKGWKQAEVIKYTTECYSVGYTAGFYVVMNIKKWNALPADVQKVVAAVSKEWIAKHGDAWDSSDKAGRDFTLAKGNKIIPLSKSEGARWAKATQPVIDKYVKEKSAKGLPAKEYVKFIKAAIKK